MYRTILLTVVVIGVLVGSVLSDSPKMISYQGQLTDSTGSPIDTTVSITFTIYNAATAGNIKWTENHTSVIVSEGLFSVILGAGSPPIPIEDSVFNQPERYLGITVGGDTEISPRTQMVSVGYSQRVNTVDGATGGIMSGDLSIQSDLSVSGKATIGPGHTNTGVNAFVAGQNNVASGNTATIGGGEFNDATAVNATIAGGYNNTANDNSAAVGGGQANIAGHTATVGGGLQNFAYGRSSAIGGGQANIANGLESTISGGRNNTTNGRYAAIIGGHFNSASADNTVAAGYNSKANHAGAIVIAANSSTSFSDSVSSSGNEQMVLRADGHFYLTDFSGAASIPAGRFLNTSTGAYLTTGGAWTNSSNRDKKKNITSVDVHELLEKVAKLEITEWNYKVDDEGIKHIGPMGQDFYATFGFGNDSVSIATVDADGVALAAIQALYKENQELKERLRKLEERFKLLTD